MPDNIENDLYPNIEECLNKINKRENFITYQVNINKLPTDTWSYLSELYEVNIIGETNNGKRDIHLFVKRTLREKGIKELVDFDTVFGNEVLVYRILSEAIKEQEKIFSVPAEGRNRIFRCYDGSNVDVIILENATYKGYVTVDPTEKVSLEFSEVALIELGKFHGMSFVLKELKPSVYHSKIVKVKQGMMFDDFYRNFAKLIYDVATKDISSKLKEKMDRFSPVMLEKYPEYMRGEFTTTRCLIHGDFRSSNIMFRKINDKFEDVTPIDFQLMSYSSPALDFIYFIISISDREFRKKNINHLKDVYFGSLTKYLEYFNIDVDSVYPRSEFEKDYVNYLQYGLMHSIFVLPFTFIKKDQAVDFESGNPLDMSLNLDNRWKDCFEGIILDYIDWGVL